MSQVEKQHYFAKTTERFEIKRCRTIKGKDSRRKFSYYYNFFIDEVKHRVCKEFYLSTLDISSRRITYFHENKLGTSSPALSKWGKHTKRKTPQLKRVLVFY